MLRRGGRVSGASLMAMADFAMYVVLLSAIGPVGVAVTTNLNINFLRKGRFYVDTTCYHSIGLALTPYPCCDCLHTAIYHCMDLYTHIRDTNQGHQWPVAPVIP